MLFDTECAVCGRPTTGDGVSQGGSNRTGICPKCVASLSPPPLLVVPPGLEACRALTGYDGTGRALVTQLKFHNRRALVPWVATQLAEVIDADDIDVITWAPTASVRRRQRGFDQAEVLARRVARARHCRAARCLVRLPGPAQTGRHRDERIRGPRFDARRGITRAIAGRRVGLVDDVVTTGATLNRAAEVLRANGAAAVIGVVIARTPLGVPHR